jgi:hypothetical protein
MIPRQYGKSGSLCVYRNVALRAASGIAVLAASCLTTPAPAAIVLTCSCRPLEQGNLNQYTISAVGTSGEIISAFSNLEIVPIADSAGVHNVWQALTNGQTPTKQEHTPLLFNTDWAAYDTYFLFDNNLTLSLGPNFFETNDGTTTGMLDLSPAFGVKPRSGFGEYSSTPISSKVLSDRVASSNVRFMQVVMKQGHGALINVNVHANGGSPQVVNPPMLLPCVVAEPATMTLFGLAMMGLVRLTRRRG